MAFNGNERAQRNVQERKDFNDSVTMKGMVTISSLKFNVVTNSARKERSSAKLSQHKAKLN